MRPAQSRASMLLDLDIVERQLRSLSWRKTYLKRCLGLRTRIYRWQKERRAA